jgi:CheY-like chemotaxis protein
MGETLGHRIELCSEVGKGTRFSVYVPVSNGVVSHPAFTRTLRKSAALAYGLAALNVVVIDNDAAVRDAMRALLERWGCNARLLGGLADVDRLMADEPAFYPDIILADFHLDNGDCGLSAVATLRAGRAAAIPAVVITADHSSEVAGRVDAAGCEILRKPVKPAELRALVTHLVR